ncbi:MAG: serine/threonine-protein kinase, partial [Planctomycetota bacterium]
LKPANILVPARGDGAPKVIDFGLARLFDAVGPEEQLRTRRGELLGTLRYMSPEQCSGDPSLLDVRTDVYALGLVLFELLTGRLPYDLEGRSLLQMLEVIRGDAPEDPRALASGVDDDLAAVMRRALEKDPESRFGSADEMADDLERWLARVPVVARRASWLHRARLFARRRTALFVGLAAGALASAVGIAVIVALFVDNRMKDRAMDEARGELAGIASFLDDVVAQNADRVVERAAFERFDAATSEEQREAVLRAVEDLRRLGRLLEGEVGDVRALAEAFEQVGVLLGNYWSASAADSYPGLGAFAEASALWRRVVAAQPDDAEARRALVSVLTRLADSSRRTGRIEQGRAAADEAVSVARRAVESSGRSAREIEDLVHALFARGDLHIDHEPFEQGLVDTREAERWIGVLRGLGHDPPRVDRLDSWTLLRLGHWLEREADDAEGGLAAHRRARELRVAIVRHSLARLRRGERTAAQEGDVQSDLVALYQAFTLNELTLAHRLDAHEALASSLLELDELFADLVDDVDVTEILPWATWYTALFLEHVDDEEERFLRRERVLWQWGERATREDADVEALRERCLQLFSQTGVLGTEAAAVRDWVRDRGWAH